MRIRLCRRLPASPQAAYECMDELLDRCYDRVDAAAFIQHLESGLKVRPCCNTSPSNIEQQQ